MINDSITTIISFYLYLYFSVLFNSPVTDALLTTPLLVVKNFIFHGQPWMVQTKKKNTEKGQQQ